MVKRVGGMMKRIFILLLYCILLIQFTSVIAVNPLYFKTIGTSNGLSNGWVRCFYQDNYDLMWIGTSDGLNRYDGVQFKVYRPILADGSEQGNITINFIAPKNSDTLLVGTDLGLYTYSYLTDEFVLSDIISDQIPILSIDTDQNGQHWIGSNRGIYVISPANVIEKRFENLPDQKNIINDNYISKIHADGNNNIWIGTKKGLSLYISQSDSFLQFFADGKDGSLSGNDVISITEDMNGNIWLGTLHNGVNLAKYKNGNYVFEQVIEGVIIDLMADSNNTLWVGHGAGGGITLIDINNFTIENIKTVKLKSNPYDTKTISENSIVCIYEDKTKNIWIGTFGKGISFNSVYDKNFTIVQEMNGSEESISNNLVNGFLEDKNYFWIATEGGLDRYDKKTGIYKHYYNIPNDKHSLASNAIFSLFKDSRDNFWVGTWSGGLHRYDYKNDRFDRFYTTEKPGSLSNMNVFSINEDKNGNLLVTTDGGGFNVFNYKTETFTVFQHNSNDTCSIGDNYMDNVHVTKKGDIIIGLYTQINRFDPQNNCFEELRIAPQHSNNVVVGNTIDIFEDSNENLWFGTSTGLIKYDINSHTSTEYTIKDGLPSNTILSIEEDDEGNLWLGTGLGLSKFKNGALSPKNIIFQNFQMSNGLPTNDFKKRSSYKDGEGFLYFGTSNGYIKFNPNNILHNKVPPKVVLTKMEFHTPLTAEKNQLKPQIYNINNFSEINLKYGFADFTIHFAALNYLYPEANQYRYMLEGYDSKWLESNQRNFATYTNIKPGEYTFKVYGSNNDKVWSRTPKTLKIIISPPWWNTLLIKIIAIFIFGLIIFVFIQLRFRILRIRNKQLQEKIEERTGDLVSLNSQLKYQKDEIEKKNIELFLHQNQLEELVKERTKELEKAKERAEESDRLKSAFLANMSHEIRTPMNAILGFSSLLNDSEIDETDRQLFINQIINNGKTLHVLINDIIDISIIEANQLKLRSEKFDVHQVLFELKRTMEVENNNNNIIIFENENSADEIFIETDKIRFQQIVVNLIKNALKFTHQGDIKYGYSLEKQLIHFYVTDTGVGIPKENQANIFQLFYKIDREGSKLYGGTGIGLAICAQLVSAMNGKIWVESEPGNGATFHFTIPR